MRKLWDRRKKRERKELRDNNRRIDDKWKEWGIK